jgi:ATP-dependent RNA helicase RhlE
MHRIGRTGRAEKEGNTILFFTEKERPFKKKIEELMSFEIPMVNFPKEVKISSKLIANERIANGLNKNENRNSKKIELAAGFHEKKEKNLKTNLGGSYRRTIKKKYKKPQTRGDKTYHKKQKRG